MNRRSAIALTLLASLCLFYQSFAQTKAPAPQQAKAPVTKTAANSFALSTLEQEMLDEINLARTNPQQYAGYLEQLKPYFKGNIFQLPGRPGLTTQEGPSALEDAIRVLRQTKPLSPFTLSRGMSLGAKLLVLDEGPKGLTGHKGTDGSFCEQRIERFGAWQGSVGENLSYGKDTARQRIMTLLIDDGFADRGHRNRLLSSDFKVAGLSCGDHAQLGVMCVITLAGGYTDRGSANAAQKF
jgi:uncharacterized protein YkwD